MNWSRFVAAVLVIAVVVALVAVRFRPDEPSAATDAAIGPEAADRAATDAATGPEPGATRSITGGEEASTAAIAPTTAPEVGPEAPPVLDGKPELTGLDGWLQSDATGLASFDGQVRIVHFWTFGCYNCKNTLPHLQDLYAEHHDDGLEIIGVHAPEFDYEADVDNIAAAAVDLGVTWPIALDTEKVNFRAWQGRRRFWPRTYVLDQEGRVRFDHIGEGAYDELAATVQYLLANGA